MSKNTGSHEIDMLHGPLAKKLMLFALPLALSSILQQLFNSADVAVVGQFATNQALAAVGCNAPVISLIITLFTGIAVGANVVIAKYIGKGEKDKISDVVHTVLVFAFLCGVAIAIAGQFIARPLLESMQTPEDTLELAVEYIRIYFAGMPFVMIYNFGSAILRSKGDTKRPLYCLIFSGVINVALNLLFVICFNMSVSGVATATLIANAVSSVFIVRFLATETDEFKLYFKKLKIRKKQLSEILQVGIPAGVQGMVFSLANILIQVSINGFGSDASAGSAAAVTFEYFSYYMVNAFAQAAVTFTSQNYGAGSAKRCKQVFVKSMILSMIFSETLSIIFVVFGKEFAGLYSSDPVVIDYALRRMQCVVLFEALTATYEISGAALRGIGHSLLPAILTLLGSCMFRVVWIYTIFAANPTYDMLMLVYVVSWIITGAAVLTAYFIKRKKEFARLQN